MHGTVHELLRMDLASWRPARYLIVLIDYFQYFFCHLVPSPICTFLNSASPFRKKRAAGRTIGLLPLHSITASALAGITF
jgi:hypothetical protein